MLPVIAASMLALASGSIEPEASVSAGAGYDSNLNHASSSGAAFGAGYASIRATGGGTIELGDWTSLYAGLRMDGEEYPSVGDLTSGAVGLEAGLAQDLPGGLALVLVPSVAHSWSGDSARDATLLAGRVTLRYSPVEGLALRASYGHVRRDAADPAFAFDRDRFGGSVELRVAEGSYLSLTGAIERGQEDFYRAVSTGGTGMGMGGHMVGSFGRNEEAYRADTTARIVSPALEVRLGRSTYLEASYTFRDVTSSAGNYRSHDVFGAIGRRF